jgi:branched-chain amino acid transport system ATP-binding protein
MLVLDDVSLAYGPIRAVRGLSLHVPAGSTVALLGRDGAGKTTTLTGIMGLLRPEAGTISFEGKTLNSLSPADVLRLGIAYVPEGRGIFGGLTVADNMACAAFGAGLSGRAARKEVARRIAMFPTLEQRSRQKARSLSGGEQQMLAIARALVSRPKLLLVDEPALGLAPIVVSSLYAQFRRISDEEGVSILLVEQYLDLALRSADTAFVLEKGELAYTSNGPDLRADLEKVASYIS